MSELSYDNWTNCFGHNASESVRLENPKTLKPCPSYLLYSMPIPIPKKWYGEASRI